MNNLDSFMNELEPTECRTYSFSESERQQYIQEIHENIKKEMQLNELREARSIENISSDFSLTM